MPIIPDSELGNRDTEIGAVEIKDGATDQRAGVDASGNLKVAEQGNVNPGAWKPLNVNSANYAKLTVSSSSVGFTGWPSSGSMLLEITCETAEVCFSSSGAATTNHPILRVGDVWVREVDCANFAPAFIRLGSVSGEIRARFLQRA